MHFSPFHVPIHHPLIPFKHPLQLPNPHSHTSLSPPLKLPTLPPPIFKASPTTKTPSTTSLPPTKNPTNHPTKMSTAHRPPPSQTDLANRKKTPTLILSLLVPTLILAIFTFRWQMKFWPSNPTPRPWDNRDRILRITPCIAALAPVGLVLSYVGAGAYYALLSVRKRRARTTRRVSASESVLEERTLGEVRYGDLREVDEGIRIVVTPAESSPVRAKGVGRMLGAFGGGYDGRSVRGESFRLEAMGGYGRGDRPGTEWPAV